METATLRTSYAGKPFAPPLAWLAGGFMVATFALVGVLYGPMTGGVLLGALALALSMLSLEFGLGFLFIIVVLFSTEEIRSISIPFFGGGLRPTDVVTAVILAGWLWRVTMRKPMNPVPRRMLTPVLAFVGLGLVGVFVGLRNGTDYKDSLLELRPVLSYLLILPIVAEFRIPQIKRLLGLIVIASWIAAIRSVFLYAQGNGDAGLYTGGRMRVMEIEFTYVLLSLVIVFCAYIHSVRRGVVPLLRMASLLAGLAVTFYRSAFLSLLASLIFLYWVIDPHSRMRWRRVTGWAAIGVIVVSTGSLFWAGRGDGFMGALGSRIASIEDYDNDSSAQHRLNEWNAALGLFAHNPLLGAGLGARVQFYSPLYSEDEKPTKGYWSNDFYMHNAYLWLATKMGAAGLLIFLFLIADALRSTMRTLRDARDSEQRWLRIGIATSLVALAGLSMFGPMFFTINQAPFAAFALASLCLLNLGPRPEYPLQARS